MHSTKSSSPGAKYRSAFLVLAIVLFTGLISGPASARADDIVLRWNEISARTATTTTPFNQARVAAIVQLAVFEAVNAITGEYEPYLNPPTQPAPGASIEAAVTTAAHKVMTTYFPAAAPGINGLNANRDADLGAIPDGPAKTAGIAVGMSAADAMIALRATDGSSPLTVIIPSSTEPGDYRLTTGCAAAMFYNWQRVTPFGIPNASSFLLDPPPLRGSNRYAKDYAEVMAVGSSTSTVRSADRAEVVRLYAATSPSFALSMATRQMAAQKGTSVSENARALALINMSISDSLVASFYNKYQYNRWRPETGIRNGDADGNDKTAGDTGFATFIATPCFPAYPSNHASGTGGGLEAMRRLFGAAGHDITIANTNIPVPGSVPPAVITLTRHYTQLKQIGDDVDDARVYGGIHWRSDQVAGNDLGRAIATQVVQNNLRPVHP